MNLWMRLERLLLEVQAQEEHQLSAVQSHEKHQPQEELLDGAFQNYSRNSHYWLIDQEC